jgi:hypothetical protein
MSRKLSYEISEIPELWASIRIVADAIASYEAIVKDAAESRAAFGGGRGQEATARGSKKGRLPISQELETLLRNYSLQIDRYWTNSFSRDWPKQTLLAMTDALTTVFSRHVRDGFGGSPRVSSTVRFGDPAAKRTQEKALSTSAAAAHEEAQYRQAIFRSMKPYFELLSIPRAKWQRAVEILALTKTQISRKATGDAEGGGPKDAAKKSIGKLKGLFGRGSRAASRTQMFNVRRGSLPQDAGIDRRIIDDELIRQILCQGFGFASEDVERAVSLLRAIDRRQPSKD